MTYKIISSMELSTLLNKTKFSVHKLSLAEYRILSFLVIRSNHKEGNGYKCWPSHDDITAHTSCVSKTITRAIKKLSADGWITYRVGIGAKNASTYYIEAEKIISAYLASDTSNKRPEGIVARTNAGESKPKEIKRNTSGLMQGKEKPVPVQKEKPIAKAVQSAKDSVIIDHVQKHRSDRFNWIVEAVCFVNGQQEMRELYFDKSDYPDQDEVKVLAVTGYKHYGEHAEISPF